MIRKMNKIMAGVLVVLLLLQCYVPVFAMGIEEEQTRGEDSTTEWEYAEEQTAEELYAEELSTIGDATYMDAEEAEGFLHGQQNGSSQGSIFEQIAPSESLYESSMAMMALTGTEQTAIVRYMDTNMVGAPYNYTGGYTNARTQGWCCAGAVSKVIYYAYDCRDIVNTCENSSWVPSVRNSLDASSSFEKVYDTPLCFKGLSADEVNALFSRVTQAGDIIIFYGPEGNTQPHCGIAGGGNALYSALVHTGFSPTTIAYYVCSGNQGSKAAAGMAVFRKKTELGRLRVCKSSDNENITKGNGIYSTTGAVYAISTSKEVDENGFLKKQLATVMIEDDGDNISSNANLEPGKYYIQEIKEPVSGTYLLNKKIYGPYEVKANQRITIGIPDVDNIEETQPGTYVKEPLLESPRFYKNGLQIIKKDAEGITFVDDEAWADVEFKVCYYNGFYDLVSVKNQQATKTWVLKAEKDASGNYVCQLKQSYLVSGSDELYLESDNENGILPYGTLTVEETKAPIGYGLEDVRFYSEQNESFQDGIYLTQIKNEKDEISLLAGSKVIAYDYKVRGDMEFQKVNQEDMKPMEGIPFAITSKTTGETHVIVTDKEGYCSTAASHMSHLYQTNGNDYLLNKESGDISGNEAEDEAEAENNNDNENKDKNPGFSVTGVWFYGDAKQGDTTFATDKRGALLYDTYIVQELPCKANEGYQLLEPFEVVIGEEAVVVDENILTNVPTPVIGTNAWEQASQSHYASLLGYEDDKRVPLIDTVNYKWLKAGEHYTIKGCLVDTQTGEVIQDQYGSYVQILEPLLVEEDFDMNPYEKCGSLDISYSVKLSGMEGKSVVFFEYLFRGEDTNALVDAYGVIHGENAIAKHDQLESEEQMIHFASIGTKAFLGDADDKFMDLAELDGKNIYIRDLVDYKNLNPDKTYKLEAQLMYFDSNLGLELPLKNKQGELVMATCKFTPKERDGQITVSFDPLLPNVLLDDENSLIAKQLVIYERLYFDDILIVEECCMDNEEQTLLFEKTEYPESKVLDVKEETPITTSPKTGDVFRLKLLLAVMLMCVGGIVGMVVLKRRKK